MRRATKPAFTGEATHVYCTTLKSYQVDTDQVASRVFEGEAVLIHYGSSEYFSLNPAGTLIWEILEQSPRTVSEIAAAVAPHFPAEDEEATAQVQSFIDQLRDASLVIEKESNGTEDPPISLSPASPFDSGYAPPALDKCGDLETLVLSGE